MMWLVVLYAIKFTDGNCAVSRNFRKLYSLDINNALTFAIGVNSVYTKCL